MTSGAVSVRPTLVFLMKYRAGRRESIANSDSDSEDSSSSGMMAPRIVHGRTKMRQRDSVIRKTLIFKGQSERFERGHGLIISRAYHRQQSRDFRVNPTLSCLLHLKLYLYLNCSVNHCWYQTTVRKSE